MHRKVHAPRVRSVIETLESRRLLSATFAANAGSGSIAGVVYNDVNGNGVQDVGEPVIVGTSVTLQQVGVTYAVGAIPTVATDVNGTFSFTSLAAGQYIIGSIPSFGFAQDNPGSFSVSLTNNDAVSFNLGQTSNVNGGGSGAGTITGTVFNDVNQDGVHTPVVEDFLSGDTVYLDLDGSGVLKPNDPQAVTNNIGQYSIAAVPGSYVVRVVPRPGFHQDPPGFSQVTIYSDQTSLQDLGENSRATISGVVFDDANGNGVQDPGELPVAGETVYIDSNLDGMLEAGIFNPSTGKWDVNPATGGSEPYAITDATGHYVFVGLTQGSYRLIVGSQVGLIPDAPTYTDVALNTGQDLIQNLGEGVPSTISGTVFDDRNGNGVTDVGEIGVPNQTVFLDLNNNGVFDMNGVGADGQTLNGAEPTAVTDANGQFVFPDINPGTYTLRLTVPPGAVPTGPVNTSHSYTFTLAPGQVLPSQNLGIQTPDLTAEIVSFPTAPTLTHVRKTALVRITDVGSLPVTGLAGITLWAQTTNTAVDESTAFIVGKKPGQAVHLAVGQSKVIKVAFAYPTQLPLNAYYVSAQVVSTVQDNNSVNDFSAPVGPVKVGPPTVDLGAAYAGEPQLIVDPGQPTAVDLILTNTGNVTNHGDVSFRIYLSLGPVIEPTDVVIQTTVLHNLHVAPGRSRSVLLGIQFPGQNIGSRYINIVAVTADPLGETNLLNNVAIEPSPTRFD